MKGIAKRINKLHQKSQLSISTFEKVEQDLHSHQLELNDLMGDLDNQITALQEVKKSAQDRHSTNKTIITNIGKLLGKEQL